MQFVKATQLSSRLRVALIGISGTGKTWTALVLACAIARLRGTRVALIDSESGSAAKYARDFDFDHGNLDVFSPAHYVGAIADASKDHGVVVIDSLSHAWMGRGGALEMVDDYARRQKGNSFGAWRDVTPEHNALVEAMIRCPADLIATMRQKQDFVVEDGDKGKKTPRKVGMAAIQRDGLEYEFDVVGEMDLDNTLAVTKSRCSAINQAVIRKPGEKLAETLYAWVTADGAPAAPSKPLATVLTAEDFAALGDNIDNAATFAELNTHNTLLASLSDHQKQPMRDRWRAKAIGEGWMPDKAAQRRESEAKWREKNNQPAGAA